MTAHQPCPDCGSSDALLINDDGSTKCFSCGSFHPALKSSNNKKVNISNFREGIVTDIKERYLTQKTCAKYSYRIGDNNVQIATYRNIDGTPQFQKIRYPDKSFEIIGTFKPILYGCHLFKGATKKLIITEGEIDCLSVYQAVGDFPVVSVPNGASAAQLAIKKNIKWIEQFEEVIFLFDMDTEGQDAAKECAALLTIGKAKIASLPLKDPNEMLKKGLTKELYKATWQAEEYRPDGIIHGKELWSEINKPIEWGLSYPWQSLTNLTYGIRVPELIAFGAGTGMGKTEFFKEIEAHLILEHNQAVGIIHLEETVATTVLGLMNKCSDIRFHIPDEKYTEEQKKEAFGKITSNDKLFIYDAYGTSDLPTIERIIRYLSKRHDCKFIFLDHITFLIDGIENANEVNQKMRNIITKLDKLTQELKITLFCISHLRKSEGKKPHEEGGRVHLDDLYGAKVLAQCANYVFGLERNQQAEDLEERHTTTFRCLKDRYTGRATGQVIAIKYNEKTGRLTEDIGYNFNTEENSKDDF